MSLSGLDELLQDAHLVLAYAVRAGTLPDDALPKAIAAAEAASPGEAAATVAPLAAALNTVARAIAPMTLVELRAGRSPFDQRHRKAARLLQLSLSVFTIVVIFLVAYYTQLLHQEDVALQALQRIQDARPLEKLNIARKMAQKEGVLGKQDSQYDQYQRSVAELRDLQDKVSGAYQLANAIIQRPVSPLAWLLSALPTSGPAQMPSAAEAGSSAGETAGASAMALATEAVNNEPDPVDLLKRACADSETAARANARAGRPTGPQTPAPGTLPAWLCGVLVDVNDEFRFSTTLGVALYSYSLLPTSSLTYRIQSDMAALNGWVLPLLYGLLGAAVFLMRSILDTRTPNIEIFPSILRIALGGIAGIVIGWFWVPGPSKNAELAAITSAPFALAFLAGFSIDILFSLLDRLNRVVSAGSATPAASA